MAALIGFGSSVLPASGYVYWPGPGAGVISRADLNGSHVLRQFVTGVKEFDNTLAAGDGHVFFGRYDGFVGSAGADGAGLDLNFLQVPIEGTPSEESPVGDIAVAGSELLWSDSREWIGRMSLDGSSVQAHFIYSGGAGNGSICVAGDYVYWVGKHSVGRATLDGRDVNTDLIPVEKVAEGPDEAEAARSLARRGIIPRPRSGLTIAVAGGYVYWAGASIHGSRAIGRVAVNDRHFDAEFIRVSGYAFDPVVAGGYIFWQAQPRPLSYTEWIGRARLDGSSVRPRLISTGRFAVGGIAADSLGPSSGSQ